LGQGRKGRVRLRRLRRREGADPTPAMIPSKLGREVQSKTRRKRKREGNRRRQRSDL
jgi:hypothetical protein